MLEQDAVEAKVNAGRTMLEAHHIRQVSSELSDINTPQNGIIVKKEIHKKMHKMLVWLEDVTVCSAVLVELNVNDGGVPVKRTEKKITIRPAIEEVTVSYLGFEAQVCIKYWSERGHTVHLKGAADVDRDHKDHDGDLSTGELALFNRYCPSWECLERERVDMLFSSYPREFLPMQC